ncbi:MAG: WG repeat-containing protein [Clostridium tyrobutyricum]|jgi:hypothetical protein|uniref:WG repeat-containing protein n=1 Tax=Clostridium tyrobutyricum TaxID=1519 RepID=UPI0011C81986|nr:WG repeat-containing protein [Clostridium tyrobutyricum]MCH4200659.1 WG repeat-containing protein [Clostridium tyrobutyricum]MCH4237557.1 WG repeat-containing protein [Clostridium tyrobutyricum]MCH4260132.1 WG repeat-containing protein [Clostridium tyrobutyricum]MCI2011758.1 WG repeat-containing protein [Clostridium tyrobutyricum]
MVEGLSIVENKTGKIGFIGINGNIAIPLIYDKVTSFSSGLAIVSKGNNTMVINTLGTVYSMYL